MDSSALAVMGPAMLFRPVFHAVVLAVRLMAHALVVVGAAAHPGFVIAAEGVDMANA